MKTSSVIDICAGHFPAAPATMSKHRASAVGALQKTGSDGAMRDGLGAWRLFGYNGAPCAVVAQSVEQLIRNQ